jgi:hypothetical protein
MQTPNQNADDYQKYDTYQQDYDSPAVPYVSHEQAAYESTLQPPTVSPQPEEAHTNAGAPPEAYAPAIGPAIVGAQQKKAPRTLWIVLAILVALLIIVPLATYKAVVYINRSTPTKTLDTFCGALLHQDYRTAYGQFSPGLQAQLTEADFAFYLSQDRVTFCTHGSADDSGKNASTSLKIIHTSRSVNSDIVFLSKDNKNQWKISDLGKQ